MKRGDEELLLRDLCARLPYGVKILHEGWNWEWDDELSTVERVVGIDDKFVYTKVINTHNGEEYRDDKHTISLFDDKIFLRPMSSMTEEEKKEYERLFENVHWVTSGLEDIGILSIDFMECYDNDGGIRNIYDVIPTKAIDWLNAHHFDYRGLIPKGLGIEAKEGMYNF